MLESKFVSDIIYELNKKPQTKAVKFVETEYTEIGTPDIIGCCHGTMFCIEAKVAPNQASEIQKQRILEWSNAGAMAFITDYPVHSAKSVANYVYSLLAASD